MKKNPIDELFAKKLAEHRQEPSQRALEHFNEKLAAREDKKRGAFFAVSRNTQWYYGAAAGVAIVLSVIGYRLAEKPNENQGQVAVNQVIKETPIKILNPEKIVAQHESKSTQLHTIVSKKVKIEQKETLPIIQESTPQVAQIPEKVDQKELTKPEENSVVAINNVPQSTENQATTPKTIENLPIKNIETTKAEKEDVILVLSDTKEENSYTTVKTSEVEEPFLKRFWTQLKNLKNGEKVDLKTLRTKPREVIARANESLFKEEREDARESWQRLKSRLKDNE